MDLEKELFGSGAVVLDEYERLCQTAERNIFFRRRLGLSPASETWAALLSSLVGWLPDRVAIPLFSALTGYFIGEFR